MNIYWSSVMSNSHGHPSPSLPLQLMTGDTRSLLLPGNLVQSMTAPPQLAAGNNNNGGGAAPQPILDQLAGQLDALAGLYGDGHVCLFEVC